MVSDGYNRIANEAAYLVPKRSAIQDYAKGTLIHSGTDDYPASGIVGYGYLGVKPIELIDTDGWPSCGRICRRPLPHGIIAKHNGRQPCGSRRAWKGCESWLYRRVA
jgi:hypothetical protein